MKAAHGLVIGKFYPPHAGHHLLIRAAARASERVTVVVMAATVESIPLALRVAWLTEVHAEDAHVHVAGVVDDLPVNFESEAIWRGHVALMREAIASAASGAPAVDALFSSEVYGDELARRLGARHVAVDPARVAEPVSGTAVRADPVAHWHRLAAPVRAWFAWRVVLVGAESTGKTTLAEELAAHLRARGGVFRDTHAVPEHGRAYTVAKQAASGLPIETLTWDSADFVAVARRQSELEEDAARRGGPIVVCDTDAFATGVWHERYLGTRSREVDALGAATSDAAPHRLYLLTHPDDVPFVQDGLRDGEAIRHWMTDVFAARLGALAGTARWQWLRGDRVARRASAIAAIDALLERGWELAKPLG